uniref:PA n=1 Tax=Longchuan virus TaxID=2594109 RepID=A0A514YA87_9ORTO|nr:PA [Longchuan virus]
MSGISFDEYLKTTYDDEIIRIVSNKIPGYKRANNKTKDEILGKIHVISCLMNTITKEMKSNIRINAEKRKRDAIEGSLMHVFKKPRRDELQNVSTNVLMEVATSSSPTYSPSSPSYNPHSPLYEPHSPEPGPSYIEQDFEPEDFDVEDFELPEEGEIEIEEDEKEFRFISPTLLSLEASTIKGVLNKNNISLPETFPVAYIDIIDTELKKVIFVTEEHSTDFLEELVTNYPGIDVSWIGVVTVDYDHASIEFHNALGMNNKNAIDFLSMRKQIALTLNSTIQIAGVPAEKLISRKVTEIREEWAQPIFTSMNKPLPEYENKGGMPDEMPLVSLEDIINGLENIHKTREGLKQATWNGKVLPFSVNTYMQFSSEKTDTEMVQEVISQGALHLMYENSEDTADIIRAFETIREMSLQECFNSVRTLDVQRNMRRTIARSPYHTIEDDAIESLLKTIGYNQKKRVKAEYHEGMVQPEYSQPGKRSYPEWMEGIFTSECMETNMEALMEIHFDESVPVHPIDTVSTKICERIKTIFCGTRYAITAAKYINICTRLGGAYLIAISNTNKSHSTVAVMPIYANTKNLDGETSKICTGFLVRGPQHVRDGTDKINFLSFERVNKDIPKEMLKKCIMFEINGTYWIGCKNAMTRAAPTFGSFMQSAMFLPTNFIGEIIFNKTTFADASDSALEIVDSNHDFLNQRFCELIFMGLLGGSQEEGYFAGYRMLYMILMQLSRGNFSGLADKDGFFEGINECLINNPYVLFMHGLLINTLLFIQERRDIESPGFVIP